MLTNVSRERMHAGSCASKTLVRVDSSLGKNTIAIDPFTVHVTMHSICEVMPLPACTKGPQCKTSSQYTMRLQTPVRLLCRHAL